jgi:hypothetical protein
MTTPDTQSAWVCSTPSPPGTTWRFDTEAAALSFARIVAATPRGLPGPGLSTNDEDSPC